MPPTIAELTEEIRDAALQVNAAQDRAEERDVVVAARESVDRVSQRYRDLCAGLDESEKLKVERALGRRLTDIRRLASLLPRIGNMGDSTPDRRVVGASEVGARRITGVSWNRAGQSTAAQFVPRPTVSVGADIDSWCGPCGELTTHHVVAMVGNAPKQVVCLVCNGRHGYRTTPARKVAPTSQGTTAGREEVAAVKQAEKKAEEMRALSLEVALAEEIRPFDERARYKCGEILSHPVFGRGKVETVLRSSLLIRFANGGLKSVMLS